MDKFKYKMRTEPEFARRVELQEALIEELKVAREAELRQILKEQGKVNYIQNLWSPRWVYASAAIVTGFLALFVVLKYFVPQTEFPLVENTKTEETVSNEDTGTEEDSEGTVRRSKNDQVSDTNNLIAIDSTEVEPDMLAAESAEEQDVEDEPVTEAKPRTTKKQDLTNLRQESDKIQVEDDVEVKRDRLLESRTIKLEVLGTQVKAAESTNEVVVLQESASKKTKNKLFRKDKEESGDEATGEAISAPDERMLKLELWESNVNFKGYLWDKETLLLYDVNPSETLRFKELNGALYMKRGAKYYQLKRSAKFESYVPLSDPTIIKSLE